MIQHLTFKKRVRTQSTLSPHALSVALTIADLRYESRLSGHEPLQLSLPQLAEACHTSPRTARRARDECIAAGWLTAVPVYRDGRQQPNGYLIADPTSDPSYQPPPAHLREPMTDAARDRIARARRRGRADPEPAPIDLGDLRDELRAADPEPAPANPNPYLGSAQATAALDDPRIAAVVDRIRGVNATPRPLIYRCPDCHARPGAYCKRPNRIPCPGRRELANRLLSPAQ